METYLHGHMNQFVDCDLFLKANDTCLVYQHQDANKIKMSAKIFRISVTGLLIIS